MVLNTIGLVLGLGLVLASYITPPERGLGRGLPLPRENNTYYVPLGARDRRYMVLNTIGLVLGLVLELGLGLVLVLALYITPPERGLGRGLPLPRENNILRRHLLLWGPRISGRPVVRV